MMIDLDGVNIIIRGYLTSNHIISTDLYIKHSLWIGFGFGVRIHN
jgi:hypothetical protein